MAGRGHHARGGKAEGGKALDYTAESNVVPEAEGERRKRGGRMKKALGGGIAGAKMGRRLDRPGRKRGGSVGATEHPLSSAAKVEQATDHKADADEE